jgi:hypothetical protein
VHQRLATWLPDRPLGFRRDVELNSHPADGSRLDR